MGELEGGEGDGAIAYAHPVEVRISAHCTNAAKCKF